MKKYFWGILPIILIVIILIAFMYTKRNNNDMTIYKSENGVPKFIDGSYSKNKIHNAEDALKSLNEIKDQFKITDVNKEFIFLSEAESEGIKYYRFQQIYNGIKIYGEELIVSSDNQGNIKSLSGQYIPNINIDITPTFTKEQIEEKLKKQFEEKVEIITNELQILADNTYQNLVYVATALTDTDVKEYIIDAKNGDILSDTSALNTAKYEFTGKGLVSDKETIALEEYYDLIKLKNRYRFVDPERNIVIVDGRDLGKDLNGILLSSLSSPSTPIAGDVTPYRFVYLSGTGEDKELVESATTTMKYFSEIYDYYKNVLNRDSYDDKGGKIVVNIGVKSKTFGKEDMENAAWLSINNQMYIGSYNGKPFSVAKDVLAHEFTHGVISHTAKFKTTVKKENINKPNEHGALNEAYADILGTLIEGKDWTIGENTGIIIRSLSNPNKYSLPSVKGGAYYYPNHYQYDLNLEEFLKYYGLKNMQSHDNGGIHTNATVVAYTAYLMYYNNAFQSKEEMAKVWYNSLFLLSPYSDFEDCAYAVIKSAQNLGLSSQSINTIKQAFIDTNILEGKKSEKFDENNLSINLSVQNGSSDKTTAIVENEKVLFKITPNEGYTLVGATIECENNLEYELNGENLTFFGVLSSNNCNINLLKSDTKIAKKTYYSIGYVMQTGKVKYNLNLNSLPNNLKNEQIKAATIKIEVMNDFDDFQKYVDNVGKKEISMSNTTQKKGIKNFTAQSFKEHSLTSSNFTTKASVVCSDFCTAKIENNILNLNGIKPTEKTLLEDGSYLSNLYYVPVKFEVTFEYK